MVLWMMQWGQAPRIPRTIDPIESRVMRVIDGDTVVMGDGTRVRLACIDAPELRQPGGDMAKTVLGRMIQGRSVAVIPRGRDRYGRVVGDVLADGRSVNQGMVTAGWAWQYPQYQRGCDRQALQTAEAHARVSRRGLWGMAGACAPWDWRSGRCRESL